MPSLSRRRFVLSALAATLIAPLAARAERYRTKPKAAPAKAPAVIPWRPHPAVACSGNGHPRALERTLEMLASGADTLDAAVAGVNVLEDDPTEMSVGLGGLPNEDGVVELDASCMHGPTHEAGAVAALRNVRNASSVARDVLWHSSHVLLVGEGALRFARARGYAEEELLTEAGRKAWLHWKASHSKSDDWLEPHEKKPWLVAPGGATGTTGTINMNVCNAKGEVSGVTSTSGLSWKIPGRVGDSPIIGAGLYVRGNVGAAGSTGVGETVIVAGGAHAVVDGMERGMHPADACLAAIRRVLDMNRMPRRWTDGGKVPRFDVQFYAVDVQCRVGGASIFPARMAVADAHGVRLADMPHVFEKPAQS
jgi:N4-(beta-N-acetylglucosaminyl)-L-asparaginase